MIDFGSSCPVYGTPQWSLNYNYSVRKLILIQQEPHEATLFNFVRLSLKFKIFLQNSNLISIPYTIFMHSEK